MAEAFGVAAGVVGLASLGVQLTDTIAKLKDARRIYKDAPDEVEAPIAALEVMNRVLAYICPPTQQLPIAHSQGQLLEDCKAWCQNIRNDIFSVVQDCQSDILSQPRLGKAKYVFRKGSIDQLLHRLQRAKLDLILAHQIYGRHDMAYQLSDLHQELRLLHQSEQAALGRITSLSDRIDRMRDSMEDMTRWSRRIEQSMQVMQSHTATAIPGVQRTQAQVLSLTNRCDMMVSQQGSLTRAYEAQQIQLELSRFQDLLNSANLDQSIMYDELHRLNVRLNRLSEPQYTRTYGSAATEESEVTEFKCFLFSYKYQRTRPPVPQGQEVRVKQRKEVVWLDVLIPSWFVRDQWAMSVARATRGWQYTLRLYRVLPDTADIFDQCMRGNLDGVRATLLERGASIYDQSRAGHTLLHVAAFAHQLEICEYLVSEGAGIHALNHIGDTPLHVMLYLMPSRPSVRQSLRLFKLLTSSHDDRGLMNNHSENARLFLNSRNWTSEEWLLFVIQLYQPRRLVENRSSKRRRDGTRVQALRRDLEDNATPTEFLLRLHVSGLGAIHGITALAAQHFLGYASIYEADLSSPWRTLCIESLRAGSEPCFVHEESNTWSTFLGSSLRRLVSTLHVDRKSWEETLVIARNCIRQWTAMLTEAGLDARECATQEVCVWAKFRLRHRSTLQFSTPHYTHWKNFQERILLDVDDCGSLRASSDLSNAYWDSWDDRCATNASQSPATGSNGGSMAKDAQQDRHMPGSFPISESSAPGYRTQSNDSYEDRTDAYTSPDENQEVTGKSSDDDTHQPACAEEDQSSWSDVQIMLASTPEAQAYRNLRFGMEGFWTPSRYDDGHGTTCSCMDCTRQRKRIRANIERDYSTVYGSTSNSLYEHRDNTQPRDPGTG